MISLKLTSPRTAGRGRYQYSKQVKTVWPGGPGPCLSNASFHGVSADGAIAQESGVSLGRTDRYVKVGAVMRHSSAFP